MSYARSPRPVCSMTIGTRLACMATGKYASWILPALLFTGNVRALRRRHASCRTFFLALETRTSAIANELRMERRMRFGAAVERAQALGALALPRRHCIDRGVDVTFVDRDREPRGHCIEQELRAHLTLRA